jgi:hypothetical protein
MLRRMKQITENRSAHENRSHAYTSLEMLPYGVLDGKILKPPRRANTAAPTSSMLELAKGFEPLTL